MKEFNAFMFVSHAAADLEGEFTDLEELLEQGQAKAHEIANSFRHLESLIQGMKYTIDFIEDDEARHEIGEVIEDWRNTLLTYRASCMMIVYSKELGKKFSIITMNHLDGSTTYTVSIDGENRITCNTLDDVRDYYRGIRK